MKKRIEFGRPPTIYLALLIMILIGLFTSMPIAVSEEIQTEDSLAPMKMKIDMEDETNTNSETITKTIYVRNTGKTPIHYVFYTEQDGCQNDISSKFQLSRTETEISPGNTFELNVTISKTDLEKYDSKDLENVKIKVVRNPESQTPVGYIIPVEIDNLNEKGNSGTKTNSNGMVKAINDALKKISGTDEKEEKNGTSGQRNQISNEDKKEISETSRGKDQKQLMPTIIPAKQLLIAGILCVFIVLAGGFYLNQKRKGE